MLNEAEFLLWCKRLGLTDKAQAIVAEVRSRHPTRRVGGGRSNVHGRYPSRKMGVTIQFESHRVELPFVYKLEHTPRSWNITISRRPSHSPTRRRVAVASL